MKLLLILDIIGIILTFYTNNFCKNTTADEYLIYRLQNKKDPKRFFIAGLIKFVTIILIAITMIVFIINL